MVVGLVAVVDSKVVPVVHHCGSLVEVGPSQPVVSRDLD